MDPVKATSTPPTLRRAVSRWEIVGLSVNDVVGSGVYLLPAAATALLGPSSVWAVLLAGLAVLLLVLCFAEAASRFDQPGSAYVYARAAFGDLVGFEVGWMTWLARVSSVASLSVGFAQAVSYLWPGATEGAARTAWVLGPLLGLTVINLLGVKAGVRTAVFLAITKTLPLVLFIVAGVFFFNPAVFGAQQALPVDANAALGPIAQAALLLLFAYAGFENTAAPAGEFKNPQRDVPFALLTQIGLVTVIYVGVQAVALGTLPGLASSQTPIADAAKLFLGSWGGLLMTIGGALSILGTNNNTVLAGPRYLYALAQGGFGPPALSRALTYIHPRFQTPFVAILVQTAVAIPLALSGTFVQLAALSVVARLVTYLGTAVAVPVLRWKHGTAPGMFIIPGGPLVPLAAAGVTLALVGAAEVRNLIAAAIALVVGALLYLLHSSLREPASP